jgi:hypothetical protein
MPAEHGRYAREAASILPLQSTASSPSPSSLMYGVDWTHMYPLYRFAFPLIWRCSLLFDARWPVPVVRDCASDLFVQPNLAWDSFSACMRCYSLACALSHARALGRAGKSAHELDLPWVGRATTCNIIKFSFHVPFFRPSTVGRSIEQLMPAVACVILCFFSREIGDVQSLGEALSTAAHSMEVPKSRQSTATGAKCLNIYCCGVRDHRARRHTPVLSLAKEGGQERANRKSVSWWH